MSRENPSIAINNSNLTTDELLLIAMSPEADKKASKTEIDREKSPYLKRYLAVCREAISEKNINSVTIKKYLANVYRTENGSDSREKEIFLPSRFQDGEVVYKHIDKIFYTLFERAMANPAGASCKTLANLGCIEPKFLRERAEIIIAQLENKRESKWSCLFSLEKNEMTVESLSSFCKFNFKMKFNKNLFDGKRYLFDTYRRNNGSMSRANEIFFLPRFKNGPTVCKDIDKIFYTLFERAMANPAGASFKTLQDLSCECSRQGKPELFKERAKIIIAQLENKPESKWSCLFFCRKNKMTAESLKEFCESKFTMRFDDAKPVMLKK